MEIVPVIDIMDGVAVRAVAGRRADYRPIETPLTGGRSDVLSVAQAMLNLLPDAAMLYVADLDGIMKRQPQNAIVADLLAALPGCQVLLDNGVRAPADLNDLIGTPCLRPVIGTEVIESAGDFESIVQAAGGAFVLSLDFCGAARLGPDAVFNATGLWPDDVIVMELSRVGAATGPDLDRLAGIRSRAGCRRIFAAGGIRDGDDLARVAALGCGALVSTALHAGRLTATEITRLAAL